MINVIKKKTKAVLYTKIGNVFYAKFCSNNEAHKFIKKHNDTSWFEGV